ncbi:unnamed protein product [Cuscuta epithymum]|uniref:Reverse transcriptase n=1 Tax=Cuscuta epithymum TaxID=186058 RepID=A0AAV0FBP8_9ASTE|nr:unnamed protein product [Cuscuta epithymum]
MAKPSNTERITQLEQELTNIRTEMEKIGEVQRTDFQRLTEAQDKRFEEIIAAVKGINPSPHIDRANKHHDAGLISTPGNNKGIKIDFPRFNGENARGWIRKCQRYFLIHNMSDFEKITLVGLYVEGNVENWYMDRIVGKESMGWDAFVILFLDRFSKENDVIGEFNKLRQKGAVEEYIDKFSELKSFMLQRNKYLDEYYFLKSFLSGLKEEIRHMVEIVDPENLDQAFMIAKKQESLLEAVGKSGKTTMRNNWPKVGSEIKGAVTSEKALPIKRLSKEELDARRRKGLCFNCDEVYTVGHKCKKIFVILMTEEEQQLPEPLLQEDSEEEEVNFGVSLHALRGQVPTDTIKLMGKVKNNNLTILVDSGSTHSFIDPGAAKRINCDIEITNPLQVTVAGGGRIECNSKCPNLKWEMAGHSFAASVRVLPLGGYDMVLGVDLMKKLGPILLDYDNHSITFDHQGEKVVVSGIQSEISVRMINGARMKKFLHKKNGTISQCFCMITTIKKESDSDSNKEVEDILYEFGEVFQEPKGLPPIRNCEHQIDLKEGENSFKQAPYRYPYIQRQEIEKLIKEMLKSGVIQPSHSPYSSPVLLVKKKDGSWRFCVDYRKLNAITIKNNYPIPLIEDLLDELHGAAVYSKIDLRAGYHQVRMKQEDIEKTAFITASGLYEFVVMPFGLTNAPATFQTLMNNIFSKYLKQFVLVFFDDILIYSPDLETHKKHLRKVFEVLQQNTLFAKRSKCIFGVQQVEYLGHIISSRGVAVDPEKIKSIMEWPIPSTLKALRGFLGMTGYFRKFCSKYGIKAKPLTDLTKKGMFKWSDEAQKAFEELKMAMCSVPILQLPNFSKIFIIETDACYSGLGAVLMQEGHPLAYVSKALGSKNLGLSIYEKEFLAILLAIEKWRAYLLHAPFIIRTDQVSLKYLVDQRISTPIQHKYLTKLLGYDYKIEYKKGLENKVADALSRRDQQEDNVINSCSTITLIQPVWQEELSLSYKGDMEAEEAILHCVSTPYNMSYFSYCNGLLRYKGKLYVGAAGDFRSKVVTMIHESAIGGHSGVLVTLQRVKNVFWWPNMRLTVQEVVSICPVCQLCKHENVKSPGLLQPLPTPNQAWQHVTMDFIEKLPKSNGHEAIFVVVDRYTKYAHFTALNHPFTASTIASVFLNNICKLHGLPESIISDRDKVFTSLFWKELFKSLGVQHHLSTAYHPQTDGQTERVNQCLESYLRCMTGQIPKAWSKWLSLAQWWYNSCHHTSIGMSPFEALFGYKPPLINMGPYGELSVVGVEQELQQRQMISEKLKDQLNISRNRMKELADKGRSEREFAIGDWVYLKLKPYRQMSMRKSAIWKLSPKYCGPFPIIEKVGTVAYRLDLPIGSQIHPVFHVSLLKKRVGLSDKVVSSIPAMNEEGDSLLIPAGVLARRIVKRNNYMGRL